MPELIVLSLNMQGVSAETIARAIDRIRPDLVALQEAPAKSNSFYGALKALISSRYKIKILREYWSSPPKIGGFTLDSQTAKNYALVYDSYTLIPEGGFNLVDFLNDKNIKRPTTVNQARMDGFSGRPPAYAKFTLVPDEKTIGVFVWHAPTRNDQSHFQTLQHFDQCNWLFKERVNNDLTLLLGDFNNSKINAYFGSFNEGVQHKFDYILCDNSTQFEDLSVGIYGTLLDMVHTTSQDHFMMGSKITF